MNTDCIYEKAIEWIDNNTIENDSGIILSSKRRVLYPEVTGYYIPSLLNIGKKELAISFAHHLCSIQNQDGSWNDSYNTASYIFDTAQILKGLVAICNILPDVKENMIKGAEWILSNINEEGRLMQKKNDAWGNDEQYCNDLIHTYCLSPLFDITRITGRNEFEAKAQKVLNYYIDHYYDRIINFTLFAHFYAYVTEAMVDCGKIDIAQIAMKNLEKYVGSNGAITGYPDVKWVCSTAMFQFAITWYKLGEKDKADKTFEYAASLQNETGGWYGCYGVTTAENRKNAWLARLGLKRERAIYLADEEISWAVKFYLDAKYYKELSEGKL